MSEKIRVLVVDDSAFMRKALSRMLTSDPAIEVVGLAQDGMQALKLVEELRPTVVTLDVKMPGMDGLETLRRIMRDRPTPVLMISSLTGEGAEATFEALSIGAVDFIDKSSCSSIMDVGDMADSLLCKIKTIAGVDVEKLAAVQESAEIERPPTECAPTSLPKNYPSHIVAIGASTGGPGALERVLKKLPAWFTGAVLVVQHMPAGFTKGLSERLNSLCQLPVKEAEEGDPVLPGRIYVAPGGKHMLLAMGDDGPRITLSPTPEDKPHRPSVDVMMKSVADVWRGRMIGIVLTGMGDDGTEGAKAMKKKGATIVAQDEKSCVVYGMPRAVYLAGVVDRQSHLDYIHQEIIHFCTETFQKI